VRPKSRPLNSCALNGLGAARPECLLTVGSWPLRPSLIPHIADIGMNYTDCRSFPERNFSRDGRCKKNVPAIAKQ
jgi:hypothetical protein